MSLFSSSINFGSNSLQSKFIGSNVSELPEDGDETKSRFTELDAVDLENYNYWLLDYGKIGEEVQDINMMGKMGLSVDVDPNDELWGELDENSKETSPGNMNSVYNCLDDTETNYVGARAVERNNWTPHPDLDTHRQFNIPFLTYCTTQMDMKSNFRTVQFRAERKYAMDTGINTRSGTDGDYGDSSRGYF